MSQIVVKQKAAVTIARAGEKDVDGNVRTQDLVVHLVPGVNEVPPEALDHDYIKALISDGKSTANTNVEVARRRYESLQQQADAAKIDWEKLVALSKPTEVVKPSPRNKTPEEVKAEEVEAARLIAEEKAVADKKAADELAASKKSNDNNRRK